MSKGLPKEITLNISPTMEITKIIHDGKGPEYKVYGAEKLDAILRTYHKGRLIYRDNHRGRDVRIWEIPGGMNFRAFYQGGSPILKLFGSAGHEKMLNDLEKTIREKISDECKMEEKYMEAWNRKCSKGILLIGYERPKSQ